MSASGSTTGFSSESTGGKGDFDEGTGEGTAESLLFLTSAIVTTIDNSVNRNSIVFQNVPMDRNATLLSGFLVSLEPMSFLSSNYII